VLWFTVPLVALLWFTVAGGGGGGVGGVGVGGVGVGGVGVGGVGVGGVGVGGVGVHFATEAQQVAGVGVGESPRTQRVWTEMDAVCAAHAGWSWPVLKGSQLAQHHESQHAWVPVAPSHWALMYEEYPIQSVQLLGVGGGDGEGEGQLGQAAPASQSRLAGSPHVVVGSLNHVATGWSAPGQSA